jgi:hypothetical protein
MGGLDAKVGIKLAKREKRLQESGVSAQLQSFYPLYASDSG